MSDTKRIQNWLGDGYSVSHAAPLPGKSADPLDPTRYMVRYLDRPETVALQVQADLERGVEVATVEDEPAKYVVGATDQRAIETNDLEELRRAIRTRLER